MEMPQPTPHHAKLALLAGNWEGDETLHPSPWDPAGGSARGFVQARMDLGGFHLFSNYRQERGGRTNFEGLGVFGWDPRGKCYTMHWFDSLGVEHGAPAIGTWEEDRLVLQHESTHLPATRYVYEVNDDGMRFLLENSSDGKTWATFLEGRYRRVGEASA